MYSYSPEFINYMTVIATTFFAVFVATCFVFGCFSNKVKPPEFKLTDKFDLGYIEEKPQVPVNVSISEVADEGMVKMEQQIRTLQTQISKIEKFSSILNINSIAKSLDPKFIVSPSSFMACL